MLVPALGRTGRSPVPAPILAVPGTLSLAGDAWICTTAGHSGQRVGQGLGVWVGRGSIGQLGGHQGRRGVWVSKGIEPQAVDEG
jgi:hypothetical protein